MNVLTWCINCMRSSPSHEMAAWSCLTEKGGGASTAVNQAAHPQLPHLYPDTQLGPVFCLAAGAYFVSVDAMSFGWPTRYLLLEPSHAEALGVGPAEVEGMSGPPRTPAAAWDRHLQSTLSVFQLKRYSMLGNNCHAFVGHALQNMQYDGTAPWNTVRLVRAIWARGQFVNGIAAAKTLAPFCVTAGAGCWIFGVLFPVCWLASAGCIALWFLWQAKTLQHSMRTSSSRSALV